MALLKTCKEKKPRTQKNFRLSDDEVKQVEKNAEKFCNGNVSEWIRYAALNFVPSESDLAK